MLTNYEVSRGLSLAFREKFGYKPDFLVRAPGRVNLIGEHTDYNDGFVLPMAIDRAVWIALRPRPDRRVAVHALDFGRKASFSLDNFRKRRGWIEYVKGVAYGLQTEGYRLEGWEGVMGGDVPRGAGLSSSAAVEMAAARAFASVSGIAWEPVIMARAGQSCENRWVGVKSGIMDQMASAAAVEGHAMFLDCRSLEYEHVPLPEGAAVVVLDTSTRRGLVSSEYNERRYQCELAARELGVTALRDVGVETFKVTGKKLGGDVFKRARHIVTENQRVLESVAAMRSGDVARLGLLLNASHASLRDDFEVSSEALNWIVEAAQAQDGCYGARMTGAGFGGCAVALVDGSKLGEFVPAVEAEYRQRSGLEAAVYVCRASAGASVNKS